MKTDQTLTVRLFALVATTVFCWAAAMACTGGSGMPPTEVQPPPPCSGLDCGLNANVPQSLYVQVPNPDQTSQFYSVDIEPNQGGAEPKSKALKGFKPKKAIASHLKGGGGEIIGVTPFGEMVVVKRNDQNYVTGVTLVGKDQEVNILQNRKIIQCFYDDIGDRVIFTTQDSEGTAHLVQRTMDGVETELYKGKNLYAFPPSASMRVGNTLLLHDDSGTLVLDLKTKKTSSFADIPFYFSPVDLKGEYWITRKDGVGLQLTKSDMSKSYPLNPNDYTSVALKKLFFRLDLNEFVFRIHDKDNKDNKADSIFRLDLKDGSVKSLYSLPMSDIFIVLDHVGDRYLVGQSHCSAASSSTDSSPGSSKTSKVAPSECEQKVGWLNTDGTVTGVFQIPAQYNYQFVVSYNPKNGTILINDFANKKLVLYSKGGQPVASLENTGFQHIPIWPTSNNFSVFVVVRASDASGQTSMGLLSPDTLGGDSGKEFALVELGTISANGQWPSLYLSDVRPLKVRAPAAVADTTEPCKPQCIVASGGKPDGCDGLCPVVDPCVPKCDGKQCGDDGCGGVCGVCGGEKICSSENMCVGKTKTSTTTIAAANFKIEDALIVSKGTMQTATGEIPTLVVKGDAPPKSVYVICGSNVAPYYLIQKFVLSADPNDSSSYALKLSGIKPEISESPKFACTTTVSDASGSLQHIKLNLQVK